MGSWQTERLRYGRPRIVARRAIGLPAGHARPAEVHPLAAQRFLRLRPLRPPHHRRHRGARPPQWRHAVLHRQGRRRQTVERVSDAGDQGVDSARRAALQRLLHALPRPYRQRQRHDRAPRLPASAHLPQRPPATAAQWIFLRRDHQRIRRHARLCGAGSAAGPLGHRGLHPRAATQPAGFYRRRAPRRARPTGRRQMMAQAVDFSITPQLRTDLRQWRTRALIAGVLGTAVSAAGFFAAGPTQFYRSYLWSYIFIIALTIGPLAWLLLQFVTGGAWGL